MPRFSLKVLLCLTLVAAAYALLIRHAFFTRSTVAMYTVCVVVLNVAVWIYQRQIMVDSAIMRERREREKRPD